MKRIVSLLPAATEIAAALGLMDQVVGVSHECDFPSEANQRPRVTHCPVHNSGMTSREVDESVRRDWEYGLNYYAARPLPHCAAEPASPRVTVIDGRLSIRR